MSGWVGAVGGLVDGQGPLQQRLVVCARHRDTSPAASAAHHNWTEYTPSQEIYEAWRALPLIVLAGLR
jgi:hypothetical protein